MQSEATRSDDIIEVATLLFRMKGYHATSLHDVAESCRMQKGSLYYHFSGKEKLAFAVMIAVQAYFDKFILNYAYEGSLLPQERITNINDALMKYFTADNNGCVFVNFSIEIADSIPAFVAPIRRYFESWENAYQAVFRQIYEADRAKALAEDFVSDLQGALIMSRITGTDVPLQRLSARLLQAFQTDLSIEQGPSLSKLDFVPVKAQYKSKKKISNKGNRG
ncbi:MAG TPA: TetR/AcrR family transcriptional regulator [Methylobacter sp.]|jgi:AcrR family transcriptional regulator